MDFRRTIPARLRRRSWLLGLALLLLSASQGRGEDRVELATQPDGKPGAVLRGTIVDIAQGQVRVQRPDGRTDSIPLTRVARYDTTWPAGRQTGDTHRQAGKFDEALEAYRAASASDPRTWVKRDLAARAVECFRETQRPLKAGELFLSLVTADPATPHFSSLPLAWTSVPAQREWLAAARRWLDDQTSPAAVLLGASWLIAQDQPEAAVERLRGLTTNRDHRIALLAEAQLWRLRVGTAAESEVAGWERIVSRLPLELRAGPYWVLGLAWVRLEQPERAALSLLRVPIEYPGHYQLAGQALELAARQLEQLDRPTEAERLRQERSARFAAAEMPP